MKDKSYSSPSLLVPFGRENTFLSLCIYIIYYFCQNVKSNYFNFLQVLRSLALDDLFVF